MKISGSVIADNIYLDLEKKVGELRNKNITPHLAVILVGANPASVAYVTLKQKKGEAIGARFSLIKFDTSVTTEELIKKVQELNADKKVHGILIQRPLPPQIDVEKLERAVDPEKDVDGFHPDSPYTLPLPLAVVKILEEIYSMRGVASGGGPPASARSEARTSDGGGTRQDPEHEGFILWLKNQEIIIKGKGPTGGGPIIKLLKKLGINPTLIDSKTENPEALMKKADIIISSVGRENMVKPEDIKKSLPAGRQGVILIGVGILRGEDGKLKGDFDPEKIKDIAGYYTPTPGGVGPVNVAMLWDNLLKAAETQTS